ncbi:hypothetical protein IEQ34_007773 [Dendrobium chrysotoxum]|uniref:Pentatricopeptide repeat-containing protein n=1 Tax=Dendrobium chrysotoxum TaxID=161865 RepID=A0AAV7H3Z5_DENCH|nr:hypothetical protein IEQ34_007773 [Dendrobium chrysotoxum]
MLPASLPLQRLPRLCSSVPRIPIPSDPQYYANLLISYSKQSARHPFDESPQRVQALGTCKTIHGRILRLGLDLSDKLGNALIDLYSKSGEPSCAQKAFNLMEKPDQISWNSILSAYLRTGSTSSVLISFTSMLQSGFSPDQFSFATALSACARLSAVMEGKKLHCYIIKAGLSCNRYCEGSLVDMYAKSGQVSDAFQVFDEISEPDIIAWTNMIAGYDQAGMAEESLRLFSRMCESGIVPDRVMMVAAMTACFSLGRLEDARSLFKQIQSPNNVAWNAVISGHAQNGHEAESLEFFRDMRRSDVRPTRSTMASILSAAANLQAIDDGFQVHTESIKLGLDSNVFVGSSLINFYIKCGFMEDARRVFNSPWEKNVVIWNAMLAGLLMHGLAEEVIDLFLEILDPDEVSFVSVVGACACMENVDLGRQFHSLAIKRNMEGGMFLRNAFIDMYSKCGELSDAKRQLDFVPVRDIVSWNSIIVGLVHCNLEEEAIYMFRRMRLESVIPDQVSCSSIISACSDSGAIDEGKQMHCLSIKMNLSSNVYVGSSLIDFYGKLGEIEDADLVFLQLTEKTLPARNALINGYVQNNKEEQALIMFQEMQIEGLNPSTITFGSILPACGGPCRVTMGKLMHCYMLKSGLICSDNFLKANLLVMYLRSKLHEDANKLFLEIPVSKSLVIWTVVISGYSQNGFSDEALLLFQEMRMYDLGFDEAILASALGACADLAALGDGRKVHSIVIRTAFQSYKHTSIALIDMYSKCGDVESSQNLFEEVKHKEDVILWNTLIVGLAKNGYAMEALEIFYQLQQSRINPDDISFLGVLTACSHAGLIDEGRSFFKSMTNNYGIIPRAHHYACMIDLLGRAGHLKEAEELINKLPLEPNGLIWATMLAASRMHEDSERGEHAADKLTKLEPYNSSPYVLLSSIYGASGNWDGVKRLRHAMKLRGIQKVPGCSWIEVRNKTSLFIAGDKFHPNANEICQVLNDLTALMKDVDCVSDIISLLLDEDEVLALAL